MIVIDASQAQPVRTPAVISTVVGWVKAAVDAWTTRRAERALHVWSDRMLRDVGLTRSEIGRAVRGQHRSLI
jgi:uncharacterized protein YjiS (DUF1127 family)